MPLARIIGSRHGHAEDELTQQLQAAGYEVEVVAAGQDRAGFADLEIELDALPADQAVQAALRLAREGADVFVAPGALAPLQAEAAARSERERLEREQIARQAAARRRQEEERRREAELQAVLLHASREQERQRLAALEAERRAQQEAEPIRAAEEQERRRLAAMEAQRQAAARQAAARPAAYVARLSDPRTRVEDPGHTPPRRIPLSRQQQWQRAAFFGSLVVLTVMLGFAAAMNLRPAPPIPAKMLQNSAQQNVPFGAASITPPAASAPVPARATAAAPKPAPRPSATRPKPARPAPRARHSRRYLEDEVVVRHFGASRSARAQSHAAVRRYSDEN